MPALASASAIFINKITAGPLHVRGVVTAAGPLLPGFMHVAREKRGDELLAREEGVRKEGNN